MSRARAGLDRTALFVMGLVLVLAALATVAWRLGLFPGVRLSADVSPVTGTTEASWFPWAVLGVGVVALVVGVHALLAHIRLTRLQPVRIQGATVPGALRLDLPAVATAAAKALEQRGTVVEASGHAGDDRGRRVITLSVLADASVDTAQLRRDVDATAAELGRVLPSGTAELLVRLRTSRSRAQAARVA